MQGLTKRWAVPEPDSGTDAPLIDRLLAARGLVDPDAARRFRDPRLTDLHDPGSLPDIDVAVARLVEAVRADEQIVIYGDYDVDGITATAILFHTIRTVAPDARIRSYVPHRLEEGYGLNTEALRQIAEEGADLVISVDCGITAVEPAAAARELGIDLVITDHHNLPEDGRLPDALAVVHPRRPGSTYPFGELCGAGVAFKLAWRFATAWSGSERVTKPLQQTLLNMLPLAAMGAIADVVPLVDENRIMAAHGLRVIRETPIRGLRALIEASNLADEAIDTEKIGFVLGPRLNACGRMGHAAAAVRLLTDAPDDEAIEIAERLAELNRERQRTERSIFEQAVAIAEERGQTSDEHRAIVLAHADWHPGVVGIVCSRLVERFGRPAILMQDQGETCKGSARSIDGYSIYDGINSCAAFLEAFGGHDAAAGLTVPRANLDAFTAALVEHANAHIRIEQLVPVVRVDCDATLAELDMPTVREIGRLSPFGRANPRPKLRLRDLELIEPARRIGANGKHLSVRLRQTDGGRGRLIRCVWWSAGEHADRLATGVRVDAVLEPKINDFNGRVSVEGELKDLRIVSAAADASADAVESNMV